ncbi:hypothetical protein [Kribbella sp. NPDC051718]|uniref:hypothetical protein n=1 Tax=Kribbella sp. NPDC051718 TaxID=3155168 RepID=UPI0034265D56
MMSVLEKVPLEVRRKAGWLIPAITGCILTSLFPGGAETTISQSERLSSGLFAAAGVLAGVLWQWFSPRDLAQRLTYPAALAILVAVIFMVPGGDLTRHGPDNGFWFPLGLIAGLVLMTRWQQLRSDD